MQPTLLDIWLDMDSRRCAEIVRELRNAALHVTNRRLAHDLNKLAEMWDEVRAKAEEIEQRELEGHSTPEDESQVPPLDDEP